MESSASTFLQQPQILQDFLEMRADLEQKVTNQQGCNVLLFVYVLCMYILQYIQIFHL